MQGGLRRGTEEPRHSQALEVEGRGRKTTEGLTCTAEQVTKKGNCTLL